MRFIYQRDQPALLVLLILVNFVFILPEILIVVFKLEEICEIIR